MVALVILERWIRWIREWRQAPMRNLAQQLYRCYAFGEELDDEWSLKVIEAADERRIPLDRLIDELAADAVTMLRFTERGNATGQEERKAA